MSDSVSPPVAPVEGQDAGLQYQYLVLRPFAWEYFTQTDEFGNRAPVRVVFTGGAAPQAWLPVFDNMDDALSCSEQGLYPTIMLRKGRVHSISMPEGVPNPCPDCGMIHWAACVKPAVVTTPVAPLP